MAGGIGQDQESFNISPLLESINTLTLRAKGKLEAMQAKGSALSIGDMFDMQFAMNKLSHTSETATAMLSAINQSINSMARNIK